MRENALSKSCLLGMVWILASFVLNGGCQFQKSHVVERKPVLTPINKLVVAGFRAVMDPGEVPDVVRDPLSGTVFNAEPVSSDEVKRMTQILFKRFVDEGRYELVSPGQARGVLSKIVDSDAKIGENAIKIIQEIGETFAADAVLVGSIYRWRERVGTNYAAERPASAAFDLLLVRPADGAVLWKAKFDKTQRSLSENILDLSTFVKGKGKWMTVDQLAMIGLNNMLAEILQDSEKK